MNDYTRYEGPGGNTTTANSLQRYLNQNERPGTRRHIMLLQDLLKEIRCTMPCN